LAAVKVTVNPSVMVSVTITIGVDSVCVSPEQSEAVMLSNTDEDEFEGRAVMLSNTDEDEFEGRAAMVLLSDVVTVAIDVIVKETLSSEVGEAETSSAEVSGLSVKLLDIEVMLAVSLVIGLLLVVDGDVDELVYNGKGVVNENEELEEEVSESRFGNLLARTRSQHLIPRSLEGMTHQAVVGLSR
jgi:hypothetical protein